MNDVLEQPARVDMAPRVADKLEAAKQELNELEAQVGGLVLDKALGVDGAADRLREFNGKLATGRNSVSQLEAAHQVALQRDGLAHAEADSRARRAQLAKLQSIADARHKAMQEMAGAIGTIAQAYNAFLELTDDMAGAVPTGLIPHGIMWNMLEISLDGRPFPAEIAIVIQAEMFRQSIITPGPLGQRGTLPGARPPTAGYADRQASIEPAADTVARMNQWIIGTISAKLDAIDAANTAKFSKTT